MELWRGGHGLLGQFQACLVTLNETRGRGKDSPFPGQTASASNDLISHIMPSTKNPNKISRNGLVARTAKARQAQQKRSAAGQSRIDKADTKRGARPGLLPTSGPRAPLSSKKKRKLEKQLGHALKRKMEAEGEVVMKG